MNDQISSSESNRFTLIGCFFGSLRKGGFISMFAKMVDEFSNAVRSQNAEGMMAVAEKLYQALADAISSAQLSFDRHPDSFVKLINIPLEAQGQLLHDFVTFTLDDSHSSNTLYMFYVLLELAETHAPSSVENLIRSTEKRISSMIAQKDERIDLCDFSFLNSPVSKRPLIFGKPQKSGKKYPQVATNKLALMHTPFFISDKNFVEWFDSQEKKKHKIRKNESGQLYRLAKGKEVPLKNQEMIFAISPKGGLYAANRDRYRHSSFLAGQPVISAGELEIKQGKRRNEYFLTQKAGV